MAKEAKTNAMRMLDRKKISYETLTYECSEFVDGMHSADLTGAPYEQSFKTLVMEGKSGSYYVFVVPIEKEVDRKAAAKAVGEKSVDMIHVKDILSITGYVRGGCSPLGMKKQFPTVFDASAGKFSEIYVSGGRIGLTLKVPVECSFGSDRRKAFRYYCVTYKYNDRKRFELAKAAVQTFFLLRRGDLVVLCVFFVYFKYMTFLCHFVACEIFVVSCDLVN